MLAAVIFFWDLDIEQLNGANCYELEAIQNRFGHRAFTEVCRRARHLYQFSGRCQRLWRQKALFCVATGGDHAQTMHRNRTLPPVKAQHSTTNITIGPATDQGISRPAAQSIPVLDFSFRGLVPEIKMIQAERAKFTNVRVPSLIFLDQWILL